MKMISALRKGASFKNQTGWKYTGVAITVSLILLHTAQSYGYLQGVTDEHLLTAIPLLVALYLQVAADHELGVPANRVRSRVENVLSDDYEPTKRGEDQGGDEFFSNNGFGNFNSD